MLARNIRRGSADNLAMNANDLLDLHLDAFGRLLDAARGHGCRETEPRKVVEWVKLRLMELRYFHEGETGKDSGELVN